MKKPRRITEEEIPVVDLAISPEKVCYLIVKAHEYDVKDQVTDPNSASNPADDMDSAVLEDHPDDPVAEEITSLIDDMSEDEQIDLVAIVWLGRGDYTAADWAAVRDEAAGAHNQNTAIYLLGMPLLGDYLEEGLALLGRNCEEYEIGRM